MNAAFMAALQAKLPKANVRNKHTTPEQKKAYLAIAETLHKTEYTGQTFRANHAKRTAKTQ